MNEDKFASTDSSFKQLKSNTKGFLFFFFFTKFDAKSKERKLSEDSEAEDCVNMNTVTLASAHTRIGNNRRAGHLWLICNRPMHTLHACIKKVESRKQMVPVPLNVYLEENGLNITKYSPKVIL